jgi:integrase
MTVRHEILGGKIQLYRRGGRFWQCSASVAGRQYRATTKREELSQAEDAAEDWYLELRGKFKRGELGELVKVKSEKTFAQAAEKFIREYPVITEGQRNKQYVEGVERRLRKHILPFMGPKPLSEVTSGFVQEYFIHRIETAKAEKVAKAQDDEGAGKKAADPAPPARNTLHQERVAIRQVLKSAVRHGDLSRMPDMSQPYRTNTKISHRAWFSPDEYKLLYKATRDRVENPKKKKYQKDYEDLHDYVLFMVNTGLRPDESRRIEFRDVKIVDDLDSNETILEIDVRGKRGVGFCKSMPGAVHPFQRVMKRRNPKPNDLVFPKTHHELFNTILGELDLKVDREGQRRTFYSLRHTYICLRLMEGADVYQIAKNCRTSVKMIEEFYASHIKNMVDASVINVRRTKEPRARTRSANRRPNSH